MSKLQVWHSPLPSEAKPKNLNELTHFLRENRRDLYEAPIDSILSLLGEVGKRLILSDRLGNQEGIAFLSSWLRKKNLEQLCDLDLGDRKILDQFLEKNGRSNKAQPVGLVCHWIAGNIPTLGLFSLFQSILCKNINILKIPEEAAPMMCDVFSEIEKCDRGFLITNSTALVSFSSEDREMGKEFSMAADMKVVWGGKEAVEGVQGLPAQEHTDTLTFGPKYSFGIYDAATVESRNFEEILQKSVNDIILFEQRACSSPHIIFFEKGKIKLETILESFSKAFQTVVQNKKLSPHDTGICAQVINNRAIHGLDMESMVKGPRGLDWTILCNKHLNLEDPIYGRTIFVKEVKAIEDVFPLISRKIQCVSLAVANEKRREELAMEITFRGVDRCVSPGKMHVFDFPWDGFFPLSRLVRWVALN